VQRIVAGVLFAFLSLLAIGIITTASGPVGTVVGIVLTAAAAFVSAANFYAARTGERREWSR
ncbi:MAG: hypothetical protein AAGC46_19265, partial [Solirubrobacteraceae bacterium]|nr:hypothetical protein [Patulibacter sp.]